MVYQNRYDRSLSNRRGSCSLESSHEVGTLALAGSWVALVEEDGVVGVVAVESSKEKVLDEIEEFDSEVVVL